ncbi:anti-sigma regulatory factor (Ser/Thr protein kinase) [Actinokineospora cianjurensis]|uniref:Anti-sigma regulatory factor (Ser/Thr protein kinase) n=1 Tax=Actinokineospora cianjurensis TaxID=585224 RepID=A0A421AW49_9PSEU|nr:anti-sigma regulatory factor (Ser/Thr protein kinase) [Actinokineospora cianjurensis]
MTDPQHPRRRLAPAIASPTTPPTGEVVELRVDASHTQLPLVRTVSGAVAMRKDFDIDSIADLRLLVDEACAMALTRALPFGTMVVRFLVADDGVEVRCSVPVLDEAPLERSGLGWTLVSSLAEWVRDSVLPGPVFPELVIEFGMANRTAHE